MKYFSLIANLFAVLSVIGLMAGLLFTTFGEAQNAIFSLSLSFLLGLISLAHRELGKPSSWVGGRNY